MSFREVLENEAELTRPIRDEVTAYERRVDAYLNELWDDEIKEDNEEEEDFLPIF